MFGHGIVNLEFTFPCQVSESPVYLKHPPQKKKKQKTQNDKKKKTQQNKSKQNAATKQTSKQNQPCMVCRDVGSVY